MGMMLLLVLAGFLLRKAQIITAAGKKCLTDILLTIILPCNIIKAFSSASSEENFWCSVIQVLAAAILIQVFSVLAAHILYRRMDPDKRPVYQYGTICSNAGFMGNPLSEGIFGETGLMYASVFLIPLRIVMWSAGASCFHKGNKKEVYKKVLTHPCMVATYLGLLILIFGISLPGVISDTVSSLSSCTTALTMMYIGTIIVDARPKSMLSADQFYFALIRLVGIPLIVWVCCRLVGIDPLAAGVCTLLSAMPAGSTTSLLASKYHADEQAAAGCVVFTTILSCVSIPIWSIILLNQI